MLLTRQQSFEAKWELDLNFNPVHVDEEAGTAVWWSKWNFASLSIRGSSDRTVVEGGTLQKATGRELVMRRPDIGTVGHYPVSRLGALRNERLIMPLNGQETVIPLPSDGSSVRMRVVAEPTAYHFYVSAAETGTFKLIQTISSRVLTRIKSPVEWMFTGTCFGVYACGALDQPSFAPAVFSNISVAGVLAGGD
jgi:beta-xylosidase